MHIQFSHKRKADLSNVLICGVYERRGQDAPIAENAVAYPVNGSHGMARRQLLQWAARWAKVNADRLTAFEAAVSKMLQEVDQQEKAEHGQKTDA